MQNINVEGFQLSPQQKGLWLAQQKSQAYRAQCAVSIEGHLDTNLLQQAVQQIVDRHEILRTTFHRRAGMKIPVQVVAERAAPSWQTIDLSDLDECCRQRKIEELFEEERRRIFDLEHGPLLHAALLTLSANRHVLLLSLPALCADAWTLNNLVAEICHAYAVRSGQEEEGAEPSKSRCSMLISRRGKTSCSKRMMKMPVPIGRSTLPVSCLPRSFRLKRRRARQPHTIRKQSPARLVRR